MGGEKRKKKNQGEKKRGRGKKKEKDVLELLGDNLKKEIFFNFSSLFRKVRL